MAKRLARRDVVSGRRVGFTGKKTDDPVAQKALPAKTDRTKAQIPSDVVAKVKAAIRER